LFRFLFSTWMTSIREGDMGGQRSLGFVFGIALAFGVVLAMTAAFPKLQSDSAAAAKTTIHRPAHY
jgi:uncharacterized membrane protein required for colicin V production